MIRRSTPTRWRLPATTRCLLLALLCPAAAGCSARAAADHRALEAFAAFQDALFQHDRAVLRRLLCRDSRAVLPALLAEDHRGKRRLEVTGVERVREGGFEYRVHVRDPNQGGRLSFFVLAVEDAEMRVDLIATTLHNHEVVKTRLSRPAFVPERLTPEEIERARARQAGQAR